MIGPRFTLGLLQADAWLGDVGGNADRIAAAARESGADLVVTPELALTGYSLGDAARDLAVALEGGASRPGHGDGDGVPGALLAHVGDLVLGLPELGADGIVYNTAIHLRDGRPLRRHRKVYLPAYGMFDEARFFGRGETVRAYDLGGGWRAGLLVCEDLWHPALAYLLATQGVHLILVLAAAPGRGVWEGGAGAARFASAEAWDDIARATARLYGVYVALANRVGVEGGICFAGGSLVVGPDGCVLARAPSAGAATLVVALDITEVNRARQPFFHGRDEDPWLTLRELHRVLADDAGASGGRDA